jgi:hypothetical protein
VIAATIYAVVLVAVPALTLAWSGIFDNFNGHSPSTGIVAGTRVDGRKTLWLTLRRGCPANVTLRYKVLGSVLSESVAAGRVCAP